MGVPGFYRWLIQRYPLVRKRLNDTCRPQFNNLYIDFNGLVYNALEAILGDPDVENICKELFRHIDIIVQVVKPHNLLYIAVDGPAPFAKCAQQRSRRFQSIANEGRTTGNTFSTAEISVGTEFMEQVSARLRDFIKQRQQTDPIWMSLEIIYSSHRVPGEGEHKFFDYIRSHPDSANLTHLICSADADLIFLSLQTRLRDIYIMREWEKWRGPTPEWKNYQLDASITRAADFEILELPLLREYLAIDFGAIDVFRVIDDFCCISYLLGNDFIPHFHDIDMQEGDFEKVVENYKRLFASKNRNIVIDGHISKPELRDFLMFVAENLSTKRKQTKSTPQDILRQNFAHEMKVDSDGFEEKIAHHILDGFDWVYAYYTHGVPSWNWYYPYRHAPPISIIAKYCLNHHTHFELDRPPYPLEQLLCVLPPQRASLLPPCVAQLMFPPSPVAKFYPAKFECDTSFRFPVPIIPVLELQKIRQVFSEIVPLLTPEELKLNSFEEMEVYPPILSLYETINKYPLTFTSADFNCSLEKNNTLVFAKKSRLSSIVFEFDRTEPPDSQLVGKEIMINWPRFSPGIVVKYFARPERQFDKIASKLLNSKGIRVSKASSWVEVKPLIYTKSDESSVEYSKKTLFVPLCLCDFNIPVKPNIQHYRTLVPTLNTVVVFSKGCNRGRCGILKAFDQNNAEVQLLGPLRIDNIRELMENEDGQWMTLEDISRRFKQPTSIMKYLLGTFLGHAYPKDPLQDVGLNIVSENGVLDGFGKVVNDRPLYSTACIPVFQAYSQTIPHFTAATSAFTEETTVENLKTILGRGAKDVKNNLAKLATFLKKQSPHSRFRVVSKDLDTISQTTLEGIESSLSEMRQELLETVTVPMDDIQWQGKFGINEAEVPKLFDVVISVANSGPVPFGTVGIVVEIDPSENQIVCIAANSSDMLHNYRKRLNGTRAFTCKYGDVITQN